MATKGPKSPAAQAMEGFRYLQVRINDDGWTELQLLRIAEKQSLQSLCIEALNDLMRKYHRKPLIRGPAEPKT